MDKIRAYSSPQLNSSSTSNNENPDEIGMEGNLLLHIQPS
jgi:hypothetical protein